MYLHNDAIVISAEKLGFTGQINNFNDGHDNRSRAIRISTDKRPLPKSFVLRCFQAYTPFKVLKRADSLFIWLSVKGPFRELFIELQAEGKVHRD